MSDEPDHEHPDHEHPDHEHPDHEHPDHEHTDSGAPSLRQRLHSATGDRAAEAHVLAEEAHITEAAANHAVRRAAGDEEEPAAKGNIARPADVEADADDTN